MGAIAAPPAPPGARRGRERDIYGGMRVAVEKMRQSVFANLPAFLRKDLQKTLPRLAALGQDNCVVPPQFSFPDPLFPAGGMCVGVTILYLHGSFTARGIAAGVILSTPRHSNPGKPRRLYNDAPNIFP